MINQPIMKNGRHIIIGRNKRMSLICCFLFMNHFIVKNPFTLKKDLIINIAVPIIDGEAAGERDAPSNSPAAVPVPVIDPLYEPAGVTGPPESNMPILLSMLNIRLRVVPVLADIDEASSA